MPQTLIELDEQGRIVINKLDKETIEEIQKFRLNKDLLSPHESTAATAGGVCGLGCI